MRYTAALQSGRRPDPESSDVNSGAPRALLLARVVVAGRVAGRAVARGLRCDRSARPRAATGPGFTLGPVARSFARRACRRVDRHPAPILNAGHTAPGARPERVSYFHSRHAHRGPQGNGSRTNDRVALVPDSVAKLLKAGHEVVIERDAGASAYFPDAQYEAAAAPSSPPISRRRWRARTSSPRCSVPRTPKSRCSREGVALVCMLQPASAESLVAAMNARSRLGAGARAGAAHHARAEHGRALVAGHGGRLQGRAAGGGGAAALPAVAHHRRRFDPAGQGLRDRRRRGRAAGHRHGAPPRRRR